MPAKHIPTSDTTEALTAELEPMTPKDEQPAGEVGAEETDKTQLKKELGLVEGVAIILGIIVGSGVCVCVCVCLCVCVCVYKVDMKTMSTRLRLFLVVVMVHGCDASLTFLPFQASSFRLREC